MVGIGRRMVGSMVVSRCPFARPMDGARNASDRRRRCRDRVGIPTGPRPRDIPDGKEGIPPALGDPITNPASITIGNRVVIRPLVGMLAHQGALLVEGCHCLSIGCLDGSHQRRVCLPAPATRTPETIHDGVAIAAGLSDSWGRPVRTPRRTTMTAHPPPAIASGDPSAWDQALYAFLV